MSGFTDMMIEDGFDDPQEYMNYLENKAIDDLSSFDREDFDQCTNDFEQDFDLEEF